MVGLYQVGPQKFTENGKPGVTLVIQLNEFSCQETDLTSGFLSSVTL